MRAYVEQEPGEEPIDTAQATNWLRLDADVADIDRALVGRLVTAAREYCEHYCDRAFARQTWRVVLDDLTQCTLPGGRVGDVDTFEYRTPDGDTATVSPEVYTLSRDGRLRLNPGQSWPAREAAPDAVQIVYAVGDETLPADVIQAMRAYVSYAYDNRQGGGSGQIKWSEVEPFIHGQLRRHRVMTL